jgi:hypothetical protein
MAEVVYQTRSWLDTMLRGIRRSSKKSSVFDDFRVLGIVLLGDGLVLLYWAPRFKLSALRAEFFSKQNKGIILDYFHMSSDRVSNILGEPYTEKDLREDERLLYWDFDLVTLEIHLYKNNPSRIAYAISSTTIRDHVEDQVLQVYGEKGRWKQEIRNIDGESKFVYVNKPAQMTVINYQDSVIVYNYLFP